MQRGFVGRSFYFWSRWLLDFSRRYQMPVQVLEPGEFKKLVAQIRELELAFGSAEKSPTATETKNKKIARRSLVASQAIKKGEDFTVSNVAIKRPGTGRSPIEYWALLGTKAARDIAEHELI